jgi:hypothetical protein
MNPLREFCGSDFARVQEEFLACLARPDHFHPPELLVASLRKEQTEACPEYLCLTKMPPSLGRIFFQQTCARGFRHLLRSSSEQARPWARERGSAQISKSESAAVR